MEAYDRDQSIKFSNVSTTQQQQQQQLQSNQASIIELEHQSVPDQVSTTQKQQQQSVQDEEIFDFIDMILETNEYVCHFYNI